ncbi:phospholipase A2 [Pilimelia columellifera]|uniref:Uncharacterized protein n=1 Tax=Pilimelia columellifera subsp. columellifera TaxID=706583 RepID=A0ABP6B118_9ACTN
MKLLALSLSLAIGCGSVAAMAGTPAAATPAFSSQQMVTISSEAGVGGPQIIASPEAPHSFRFDAGVPAGGKLAAVGGSDSEITGHILVKNSRGETVGAWDEPWANDANMRQVITSYRIEGTAIVQTVDVSAGTAFPLTINPVYSAVGGDSSRTPLGPSKVTVPSNYLYDPDRGSLHDYCTHSPDEWYSADFRGPCARHDQCYARPGNHKKECDNQLEKHLTQNCDHAYGPGVKRTSCHGIANTYWAAVTAGGDDLRPRTSSQS